MAKVVPKDTEVNADINNTININGVLRAVLVLSCILGFDRVYLITKAPLYQIISKSYAGCLFTFTVVFYVRLYLQNGVLITFIDEYVSAFEYCGMIALQLLRSKETCKEIFENIHDVNKSLKVKVENYHNKNVRYFSILCLVQSTLIAVIPLVILWLYFDKVIPLPSLILTMMSVVHDLEFLFIGNLMIMIESRISLVNAHLKNILTVSEEQFSGDRIQLEATKRTELDTYDLYQIYIKLFSCYERLKRYMNFPVTILMVNTFLITHNTFVRIADYANENAFGVESNGFVYTFIGISMLKCIAGLVILGVLGSRTTSASAAVPHTLADIIASANLEKAERRRLKGFLRSCAERPFRYALCFVIPLDVTLPVNFVAVSVSYVVVGAQFVRLRLSSGYQ